MLKEEIDKEFERADNNMNPDDITEKSAVGEMRIVMTKCVGEAWEKFCREKREVIIRNPRCIGASLPIDGSSDGEISTKATNSQPDDRSQELEDSRSTYGRGRRNE